MDYRTDRYILSIPETCPHLTEIGFTLAFKQTNLPIDQLFANEKCHLTSLHITLKNGKRSLKFPQVISFSGTTYSKLKKLNFNEEIPDYRQLYLDMNKMLIHSDN